jgi:hypothetical protein
VRFIDERSEIADKVTVIGVKAVQQLHCFHFFFGCFHVTPFPARRFDNKQATGRQIDAGIDIRERALARLVKDPEPVVEQAAGSAEKAVVFRLAHCRLKRRRALWSTRVERPRREPTDRLDVTKTNPSLGSKR